MCLESRPFLNFQNKLTSGARTINKKYLKAENAACLCKIKYGEQRLRELVHRDQQSVCETDHANKGPKGPNYIPR